MPDGLRWMMPLKQLCCFVIMSIAALKMQRALAKPALIWRFQPQGIFQRFPGWQLTQVLTLRLVLSMASSKSLRQEPVLAKVL